MKLFSKIASLAAGLALVAGTGVALASHAEVKGVRAADVTDTITASDLAATSTTYTDFSGVSKTSSAVYAGQSAKSSGGGIQLRSKNSNSGIVSTTSGGTVKSVTITVESGSKTVDVYGSNSAYSAASDLYGNSKGTKVGSTAATGTITFTDSYSYVGIRSNDGAIYLTSIEIVWDDGQGGGGGHVHTPGTAVEENRVEATCTVDGSYDSVVYCTECEEKISSTHIVIPATGHNFVDHVCTVCGAEESDETITNYDFSTAIPAAWEASMDKTTTDTSLGRGIGWGAAKGTITLTLSNSSTVSSVVVTASTNNAGNTLSVSVGETAYGAAQEIASGTDNKNKEYTFTGDSAGDVVVTINDATKTVWVLAISVTTTESTPTPVSTYSVTYNGNGSSSRPVPVENLPSNITGLEDGETASLTGSPTRWGYTFLGWGASASATETISSVTIDGANETVYALWQEDHTVAGAWSDSPYTVAQARTAIDDNEHLTDVYVSGIVSQVDSYNSTYKSVTYWISDDGTTTDQFEVYSGKGLNGADFTAVGDVEVGAQVVVNGNIKKYSSTYEFDYNNKQISYVGPSTGDIEVTFAPSNFLGVADSGTYTASTDAENPTYSFSSSDSNVLSVASNGVYSAVSAGTATVRVDVTSSDGNGYKEVAVTVVEVKSVSEAYEIAAALSSGATTDYSIKVTGSVSSLDADGKTRAINFTDGSQVIEVFFGGGNADYTTVTSTAFIGSKVTVFGKVQNYSGTYELKDITLGGVAAADANSYAAGAYKSLDGSCETGVDAVTEDQWTAVSNGYAQLSSTDQAIFREDDLSPHGEEVIHWVERYEIIVANTALSNFMSLSVPAGRFSPISSTTVDSNTAIAVVAIVAIASISAIAVILVIKRRKAFDR